MVCCSMLEGKFIKAWRLVYLHVHICLYVMRMLKFIASYNPLSLSLSLSLSFSLALSLSLFLSLSTLSSVIR